MSKIGRQPINISGLDVNVTGSRITFKGPNDSGEYILPNELAVQIEGEKLFLKPKEDLCSSRDINRIWGLHRALLSNELKGGQKDFEKKVEIVGLGFKAAKSGDDLVFSLGYSHKIDFPLPKEVSIDIDKTGQKLTLRSSNRELLGQVCSDIASLREPEPYKGIGIKLEGQHIHRKVGKTK